MKGGRHKFGKISLIALVAITALYSILLIPSGSPEPPNIARSKQFIWNRDSVWFSLESLFAKAKKEDCGKIESDISNSIRSINVLTDSIMRFPRLPGDPVFQKIENKFFYTAAVVGACNDHVKNFINLYSRIRSSVKVASRSWDMNGLAARQTIYKLIYGGRAALEEVILQNDLENIPTTVYGDEEYSATPSSEILGVKVHSGDLLVSRGGAPTSALIARGNDYPGNFSHVALLYVDAKTKAVSIIESHIERGVVISTVDDYLKDKKLRVMILRIRADLDKIKKDPMLPHRAAEYAFNRTAANHIPYDFEMNYHDNSKLFCSEVASDAYGHLGINLWMGVSSISSYGVANWLAGFGVKYFETQEPSDLEYDPQLTVAAEWRDKETLHKDHIDNAIIEALLEKAQAGKELGFDWYMLPVARMLKIYSSILNIFGKEGPVPEGMSAESALRHKKLVHLHKTIIIPLEMKAKYFEERNGYTAPYWRLVEFARETINGEKLI